ncbi:MAG: DUF2339 domain-containing protein, partial [Thalassospira sp.]|uniref:DUF2339 domain-containing protein n=1 Tax=Thalassospira sp. TaxID=1912094 RepID=UPI0032EACCE4
IGLMTFVGAIMGIIAFFQMRRVKQKLYTLEQQLSLLQAAPPNPTQSSAQPETAQAPPPGKTIPKVARTTLGVDEPKPTMPMSAAMAQTPQSPAAPAPKQRNMGFEEQIGTRWAVWLGGITLVLGGIFLVRYSIESGMVSPLIRISLAAVFAAALFGAGEYLRRQPSLIPAKAGSNAGYIPGVLTLAGTTTAFATIYSAHLLYGMIGPATAFVLMAIVALGTLALALLQGPLVASTGLLASYIVPFLVQSNDPAPWVLVFYGLIVTAGSYGIARLRKWHWFAMATAIAGFIWGHVLAFATPADMGAALALYDIVVLLAAIAVFAFGSYLRDRVQVPAHLDWKSSLLIALNGWLVLYLLHNSGYDATGTTTLMVTLALLLATAVFFPVLAPVALAAPLLALLGYLGWEIRLSIDPLLFDQPIITDAVDKFGVLPDAQSFLLTGLGFGLILGIGGFAGALFSTARLFMAVAGVSGPIGLFLIALWRSEILDVDLFFGGFALALAAAFLGALAIIERKMPSSSHDRDGALATYCVGTLGMIATAMFVLLGDGWLPLGLASLTVATIWVSGRWPLPGLARTGFGIGILVLLAIFWQPTIVPLSELGTTPVFNALLWGYGGPALAFWACVWKLRQWRGPTSNIRHRLAFEGLAVFTSLATGAVILHHATNQGAFYSAPDTLMEWSLQALLALSAAIGLQRLDQSLGSPFISRCILGLRLVGFIMLGLLNLVFLNPLFTNEYIGNGLVFNLLLSAYFVPAVLTGLLATRLSDGKPELYPRTAGILSILLAFCWITFEIRHVFHSGYIGMLLPWSSPELYSYSAAWLGFGIVLLIYGVWRKSLHLRMASAAFVCLAIAKAFLFDMSSLEGIWRALSFIGLGIVLIGIGLFYQRVLARQNETPENQDPD